MRVVAFVCVILAAAAAQAAGSLPPSSGFDVAAADNAFGFRLLAAVQKEHPAHNVVLSPVSAAVDLSMALNGGSGETSQEMRAALSLDGVDLATLNSANAQLIAALRTPVKGVTISTADSIWTDQRRISLSPAYVAAMRKWYLADVRALDFGDPEAPAQINAWASRETHGRIPVVIQSIDPFEVAFLLNAVYFKGDWAHKFDKSLTQPRPFTLADGTTQQLPRMQRSGTFDYFQTNDLQAVRLPYVSGDLAMYVLLPSARSDLATLESELTPEHWATWRASFAPLHGTLELPRYELKNEYQLKGALQTLGMRRAFDRSAQFGGLGSGSLSISFVKQDTYLRVDEEGSEAAAVTTIGVVATIARPVERPFSMIVDHPFFCAIEDRRTGALLFVGAIYDPRG